MDRRAMVMGGLAVAVVAAAAAAVFGFRGRDVVVGMDLGTSYSTVAYRVGGSASRVQVLRNVATNSTTTASVVTVTGDGHGWWVGPTTAITVGLDPVSVVYDTKRVLGRKWEEEVVATEAARHGGRLIRHPVARRDAWGRPPPANGKACPTCTPDLAFVVRLPVHAATAKLAAHPCIDPGSWVSRAQLEPLLLSSAAHADAHPPPWFSTGGRQADSAGYMLLTPTAVGCLIVRDMMGQVATVAGVPPPRTAVITIPAEAGAAQRAATEDAYKRAGLTPTRVLMEPAAAAVAYGLHRRPEVRYILVFDMGGGTLDVTLMFVQEGAFTLIGAAGDGHLGGDDFDECVMGLMEATVPGVRASGCPLKQEAERVKIVLGDGQSQAEAWRCGGEDEGVGGVLTRAQFEEGCAPLFQRVLEPVREALSNANLRPDEVQEVVLVGGSSRLWGVRAGLATFFATDTARLRFSVDPDTAVAVGAASVID